MDYKLMVDAFESYYSFLEKGYESYGYAFESENEGREKIGFFKNIKTKVQNWCYKMHTTFRDKSNKTTNKVLKAVYKWASDIFFKLSGRAKNLKETDPGMENMAKEIRKEGEAVCEKVSKEEQQQSNDGGNSRSGGGGGTGHNGGSSSSSRGNSAQSDNMNTQKEVELKSIESFINYCDSMIIAEEGLFTKMLKKHSDRKQARLKEREECRQAFIANKKQAIPHVHKLANEFVKVYNTLVGSQVMEIDKNDIEDYDNQYAILITVNSDSFDRDALSKTISNIESKFGTTMDKYRISVFTEFGGPWVSVGVDDVSFNAKDWSEWNRFLN